MNTLSGSFKADDWERIAFALLFYYDQQYAALQKENVGDRVWDELSEYKRIMDDIETFILAKHRLDSWDTSIPGDWVG